MDQQVERYDALLVRCIAMTSAFRALGLETCRAAGAETHETRLAAGQSVD